MSKRPDVGEVHSNGVIGKDCDSCDELCVMKFTDEEWEAHSRFARDINDALQEKQFIEDDINEYWQLKNKLNKEGLMVEDVVNINISYLRRRKKEVEGRIRKLRKMEYYYTKKLLKRQE